MRKLLILPLLLVAACDAAKTPEPRMSLLATATVQPRPGDILAIDSVVGPQVFVSRLTATSSYALTLGVLPAPDTSSTLPPDTTGTRPPNPPPPTTGAIAGADFTTMRDTSELRKAGFAIGAPQRVTLEPGKGVRYQWVTTGACAEQTVNMALRFPGATEIWIEAAHTFDSKWSVAGPANCSPNPDYKTILAEIHPTAPNGGQRFDFRIGTKTNTITGAGDAFAGDQHAPLSVIQPSSPIAAPMLWDGKEHVFRLHFKIYDESGVHKSLTQIQICDAGPTNCQTTHSYIDVGNDVRAAGAVIDRIKVGANRNVSTAVETFTRWRYFYVFSGPNAKSWFNGVPVADYSN